MQNNNEKVALFDFCETLTDFQTADAFVNYVREKKGNRRAYRLEWARRILLRIKIISIVSRLFPKCSVHKRFVLYQLKGYSQDELEELAEGYYNERIKPGFIKVVIERLKTLQNNGYKVGLVSGGYDIYLINFVNEFKLDFIISSCIEFANGVCTGKMKDLDCLDENKVKLLGRYFAKKPHNTIAFSDSKSDLPLLNYADKGVVVSHNIHQAWVDNNKFEEIIWD